MKSITIWLPLTFLGLTVLIALIKIGRKHEWFSKLSQNGLILELDSYFEGRKRLTEEEFYIQYFEDQGVPKDLPIKVRKIFEEQFEADFSIINNRDDFSEDMKFIWGYDSMVDVEIVMALEEEFDIKIEDSEAEHMRSIQDIVMCIWNKKIKDSTITSSEPRVLGPDI